MAGGVCIIGGCGVACGVDGGDVAVEEEGLAPVAAHALHCMGLEGVGRVLQGRHRRRLLHAPALPSRT